MKVKLIQIDGKLPNLALMKLAAHHRACGDEVHFGKAGLWRGGTGANGELGRKVVERDLFVDYDRVYASAIFSHSAPRVAELRRHYPEAIVGGTWDILDNRTVEDVLEIEASEVADYSIYPNFTASIGFTQRGCRLKCGFCVVPKKEGKNHSVQTIHEIWRGNPWPKHLHLLDNDFFGQPREQWEARVDEIISGGFRICLNQGINVRMIDEESASALGRMQCYNDRFDQKAVYTAWDSLGDEKRFFTGVDLLEKHGTPASRLRVYMLVGYDPRETWERVLYRYYRMTDRKIRPYPMIYGERVRGLPSDNPRLERRTLDHFQRWVLNGTWRSTPFEGYRIEQRAPDKAQLALELL